MASKGPIATDALVEQFLIRHPRQAAERVEALAPEAAARVLAPQPPESALALWQALTPDTQVDLLGQLPEARADELLSSMDAGDAALLLGRLPADRQRAYLDRLSVATARELRRLMTYPPGSVGLLMDARVLTLRPASTVHEALEALRAVGDRQPRHELFVVDSDRRPVGRVPLQELALADLGRTLEAIARPVSTTVLLTADREAVVRALEEHRLAELPVVNMAGRLVGVIRHGELIEAVREETSADLQTMVGVSKDERALSTPWFAVRRRLGWLHINLVTAFVAAAVVGLFESVIAQVTALAVLLPVVAGQSGNAGAQAMAVTMRGLALHEIGVRHWLGVAIKEAQAGLLNGVAIAITCGAGVWVWSQSLALAGVIAVAMVVAMTAAGLSGALVPITLTRFGQDPAQASSIILTTVTDVVGFFAFLGIAALMIQFL